MTELLGGYGAGVDGVRDSYRRLAVGELEWWLRQRRDGAWWPTDGYDTEIDRLAVQYLRGAGWDPSTPLDAAGEDVDRWRALLDGVHEAGVEAWRRATGTEPWRSTGPGSSGGLAGMDAEAVGQ